MTTLLSFGEALIDFLPQKALLTDESNIQQQTAYLPLCGGAPANVAVAYAKLGGNSFFAGGLSDDSFGQLLQQQFELFTVNTDHIAIVQQVPTAIVLVTLDQHGERTFSFYRDNSADMLYSTSDVNKIEWPAIDIFHFCSNTLTTTSMAKVTLGALAAANSQQKLVSFDVNLRYPLWQNIEQLPQQVEQCFHYCDILKFSKEELDYLAEKKCYDDKNYINFCLQQGVSLILITDGANAIKVFNQNSQCYFTPPQIAAVDTTAAGDSFIASFLYQLGKLHNTKNSAKKWLAAINDTNQLQPLLNFASQCSALTCTKKGGFAALPTQAEIQSHFT
jgi:fructokinase